MNRTPEDHTAPRRLDANTAGVAVVEFALVAPLLLMMMLGILSYGGYFWMAHSVQQAANDAARATIAGLDLPERRTLADAKARALLARTLDQGAERSTVELSEHGDLVTVEVAYDASASPFLSLGLVPMPEARIQRRATISLAGL